MCVALTGEVIAVDDDGADVLVAGHRRRVSTVLVPDIAVGDYVLITSGLVTDRLSEDEARERTALFDELLEAIDEAT